MWCLHNYFHCPHDHHYYGYTPSSNGRFMELGLPHDQQTQQAPADPLAQVDLEAERQKAQEVGNAQLGVMVESRAMDKDGRFCSILINKTGIHLYTYYIYIPMYILLYIHNILQISLIKSISPGSAKKVVFGQFPHFFPFFEDPQSPLYNGAISLGTPHENSNFINRHLFFSLTWEIAQHKGWAPEKNI